MGASWLAVHASPATGCDLDKGSLCGHNCGSVVPGRRSTLTVGPFEGHRKEALSTGRPWEGVVGPRLSFPRFRLLPFSFENMF